MNLFGRLIAGKKVTARIVHPAIFFQPFVIDNLSMDVIPDEL